MESVVLGATWKRCCKECLKKFGLIDAQTHCLKVCEECMIWESTRIVEKGA